MSKEFKGVLSPELESKIAQWLDDAIKLPAILEAVDGMAFKLVISQLDNKFGEMIPQPYKGQISELFEMVFDEQDYTAAITLGFEALDTIIDLPLFDDETEALIFEGFAQIVIAILAKMNIING
jgi:hypothetical protein